MHVIDEIKRLPTDLRFEHAVNLETALRPLIAESARALVALRCPRACGLTWRAESVFCDDGSYTTDISNVAVQLDNGRTEVPLPYYGDEANVQFLIDNEIALTAEEQAEIAGEGDQEDLIARCIGRLLGLERDHFRQFLEAVAALVYSTDLFSERMALDSPS